MPIPRIPKDEWGTIYFLTLTVIEWINIFTKHEYFEVLVNNLRFYQKKGLRIHGYVLMTNHLHLFKNPLIF